MGSIIIKFSFLVLFNLLAFLLIWHILDVILDSWIKYKIIFLVLSVISLVFLSKMFFKKALSNMEKNYPENNNKIKNESK